MTKMYVEDTHSSNHRVSVALAQLDPNHMYPPMSRHREKKITNLRHHCNSNNDWGVSPNELTSIKLRDNKTYHRDNWGHLSLRRLFFLR